MKFLAQQTPTPSLVQLPAFQGWLIPVLAGLFVVVLLLLLWRLAVIRRKTARRRAAPAPARPSSNSGQIRSTPLSQAAQPAEFGLELVGETGQVFHIQSLPASIGRDPQNQVVLEDPTVSSQHARLYFHELAGAVCIEDLGSLNGVLVNDKPTRKNILQDGIKITCGSVSLTFRNTGYIPPL